MGAWGALATTVRVVRTEGFAAARDRALDRLAEARRAARYTPLKASEPVGFESPVLNLLATPPSPLLGGVPIQFRARMRCEERERPTAVLYPSGRGYRLEVACAGARRRVDLAGEPAGPMALADGSFEEALRIAADRVGARIVHAEGVAGLPLESLLRIGSRGRRFVLSLHDFALFCVRPHLVERPFERFCDYCRDLDRCRRCLRADWPVSDRFQADRRAIARELLASAEAVVYPSSFLRERHEDLFGPLESSRQHVIPPAVALESAATRPSSLPVKHVAYVGAVHPHKGASVFEDVVREVPATPAVRFTVFGGGDPVLLGRLRGLSRVRIRGYYRAGSLPELLRREAVDIALLLSIWPESYGITLDECRAAGVPVVAFDLGALGESLRHEGGGSVVPFDEGGPGVARRVAGLIDGSRAPAPWARTARRGRPSDAATSMLALYASLIERP